MKMLPILTFAKTRDMKKDHLKEVREGQSGEIGQFAQKAVGYLQEAAGLVTKSFL
jgi:hypothetical protein